MEELRYECIEEKRYDEKLGEYYVYSIAYGGVIIVKDVDIHKHFVENLVRKMNEGLVEKRNTL